MAFVAPEGISTAASVSEAIGINTDSNAPSGVVVKLESGAAILSGVLPRAAVVWIRAALNE